MVLIIINVDPHIAFFIRIRYQVVVFIINIGAYISPFILGRSQIVSLIIAIDALCSVTVYHLYGIIAAVVGKLFPCPVRINHAVHPPAFVIKHLRCTVQGIHLYGQLSLFIVIFLDAAFPVFYPGNLQIRIVMIFRLISQFIRKDGYSLFRVVRSSALSPSGNALGNDSAVWVILIRQIRLPGEILNLQQSVPVIIGKLHPVSSRIRQRCQMICLISEGSFVAQCI